MGASEAIAIASVAVAFFALLFNVMKDKRGDMLASQTIRDKLDYISDTARDTREDVRALDRKLDDHATRIGKIETKLEDHERRMERLES